MLQGRHEYFSSARSAFTGENNQRRLSFALERRGGDGACLQSYGDVSLPISELAQIGSWWQEQ